MNGIRLTSPDYPAGRAAFCFGVLVSGVVIFGGLWRFGVLLPAIFCLSCIVAAKMRVRFYSEPTDNQVFDNFKRTRKGF